MGITSEKTESDRKLANFRLKWNECEESRLGGRRGSAAVGSGVDLGGAGGVDELPWREAE
jgi:hypothetical protein